MQKYRKDYKYKISAFGYKSIGVNYIDKTINAIYALLRIFQFRNWKKKSAVEHIFIWFTRGLYR